MFSLASTTQWSPRARTQVHFLLRMCGEWGGWWGLWGRRGNGRTWQISARQASRSATVRTQPEKMLPFQFRRHSVLWSYFRGRKDWPFYPILGSNQPSPVCVWCGMFAPKLFGACGLLEKESMGNRQSRACHVGGTIVSTYPWATF